MVQTDQWCCSKPQCGATDPYTLYV